MDLSGRTAMITGGNRGIGPGIAKGLVAAGSNVVIVGRDTERNRAAVDELGTDPGRAIALACDVIDAPSLDRTFEAAANTFGKVDGIFINAGSGGGGRTPFQSQSDADWDRIIAANLTSARRTAQVGIRHMLARNVTDGRIIFSASVAARFGAAYNQHRETYGSASLGNGLVDGIAFDAYGNLWATMIFADRLIAITPEGELLELMNDGDPKATARFETIFATGANVPFEICMACGGPTCTWLASITFGGPDLATVYLGGLRNTSIPYFRSPVGGLAMSHWGRTK